MRAAAALVVTLLLPAIAWAVDPPPAPTVTPTSMPTPTTRVPRPPARLQGMPTGLPGFGVPGEPPTERPATEKPLGNAP
jgi:hypothetical protein